MKLIFHFCKHYKFRQSCQTQLKFFKAKVILSILQGDKEFNEICGEHNLNPNIVRKWKQDFLQKAHLAFWAESERKNAQRKEDDLKKNDQMLKTIGQLTLERDFLQD